MSPPSPLESSNPTNPTEPAVYFRGSCACNRLTYTCASPPSGTTTCFCITCRKLSGSSSMTFTHVPASSLTVHDHTSDTHYEGLFPDKKAKQGDIVSRGLRVLRLSSFAERVACLDCGTPLAMRMKAREWEAAVCVGSVDDDGRLREEVRAGLKAGKAIFVKGVPVWVDDVGGLGIKTCDRFDNGFEEEVTRGYGVEDGKLKMMRGGFGLNSGRVRAVL